MNYYSTNRQAFFALSALFLIFVEAAFFGNGSVFLVLLGIGLIYYGNKNSTKYRKSYFWTGFLLISISILSMWSLRMLILAAAVYLLLRLWKGEEWQQEVPLKGPIDKGLIQNKFFSAQATPIESYEWKDIHVQGFIGDLLIDVTQTVLPKRASLVSIRQGFGRVRLIVPYEVPVRIYYSTVFGDARFFNGDKQRLWYGSVQIQDGYEHIEDAKSELIVSVTTWMGDVEVIRR